MSESHPSAEIKVPYSQFQIYGIVSWIESNGYKPYVHVCPHYPGVQLPPQCMSKDMELINMDSAALAKMHWEDDRVSFNARFGGKDFRVILPYEAMVLFEFRGTVTQVMLPWGRQRLSELSDRMTKSTVESAVDQVPVKVSQEMEKVNTDSGKEIPPSVSDSNSTVRHVDFAARRRGE